MRYDKSLNFCCCQKIYCNNQNARKQKLHTSLMKRAIQTTTYMSGQFQVHATYQYCTLRAYRCLIPGCINIWPSIHKKIMFMKWESVWGVRCVQWQGIPREGTNNMYLHEYMLVNSKTYCGIFICIYQLKLTICTVLILGYYVSIVECYFQMHLHRRQIRVRVGCSPSLYIFWR